MRTRKPPRGLATCSATCWPKSVVPMVKRQGTLRAPSSRTRPVQRTSRLQILFIDLLSSKLETSQVVEVLIFAVHRYPSSAHCLIYSRYPGCPAPIVPFLPLRQLMASVGPQIYSRRSPHPTPSFSGVGALPSPPPRAYITRRRHALPHVFRFNGCWSSFRSLLFAFRRFRSFPRSLPSRFPRTGHPLTLFTLILSMRMPPTRPLCVSCLPGHHSSSSVRNLFLAPL